MLFLQEHMFVPGAGLLPQYQYAPDLYRIWARSLLWSVHPVRSGIVLVKYNGGFSTHTFLAMVVSLVNLTKNSIICRKKSVFM